jgi:glycolate oxidase iron-sulfur subunit
VDYHLLLDIGREVMEELQPRPLGERLQRRAMVWLFSDARRFAPVMGLARAARPLLPARLRQKIMPRPPEIAVQETTTTRRMLLLDGCVQPVLAPQINQALRSVLGRLGIALESAANAVCCGALPQHLSEPERAREMARRNIDAWWPLLQQGAEAVVVSASGCTAQLRDYPHLLEDDPAYAEKARDIARHAKDPVEILLGENLETLGARPSGQRIAVHTPCTQQHGLGLDGAVARLLSGLGYRLTEVAESHLCCGSAGTYSLTQPKLSQRLRLRKLEALNIDRPDRIVTANIGCQGHLQDEGGAPVSHWLNLLAEDLSP